MISFDIHFTFYILHFTFYILHFTFYILHFTFLHLHYFFTLQLFFLEKNFWFVIKQHAHAFQNYTFVVIYKSGIVLHFLVLGKNHRGDCEYRN